MKYLPPAVQICFSHFFNNLSITTSI